MKVVVCVDGQSLTGDTRAALGLALGLGPEATVIALAAGSNGAPALEEARRLGAHRAAQVGVAALDGIDPSALGFALAGAARRLEATLVLAGARSELEGRGIVPAALAHHLGAPYLPYIEELGRAGAGPDEVAVVLRGGGLRRRLAVRLPAVLTVGAAAGTGPAPDAPPAVNRAALKIEALPRDERPPPTTRVVRPAGLGVLERPRTRPVVAATARELLTRWRA